MRGAVYDTLRKASSYKVRQWFKRQPWFVPTARLLFGNQVYSQSYYSDVERLELTSVPHIANWVKANLQPRRVIDVGCGPGHLMSALEKVGIATYGVDVSDAALDITKRKGLKTERFDLTASGRNLPGSPYDLALSCEVAEHLEGKYARQFVEHLTNAATTVYLTATEPTPGAGVGMFHVNEQPRSYWINLFNERGYEYQAALSEDAARHFAANSVVVYLATPMVFKKRA